PRHQQRESVKKLAANHLRVLAIDPSARGFGFAVLEGPERPIDWGVRHIKQDKNISSLKKIDKLVVRYQPEVIVVEDTRGKDSRRCLRIRKLIRAIARLALRKKIKCRSFSRSRIQKTFSRSDVLTRYQIATIIAEQFLELVPNLPPPRKLGNIEDWRMSIFV